MTGLSTREEIGGGGIGGTKCSMASYLRSLWYSAPEASSSAQVEPLRISPPIIVEGNTDGDDDDYIEDNDDDLPPSFPAPNSIQRSKPDSVLMPPPPINGKAGGLSLPPSTIAKPKPRSRKVALAPGHSPLDWACLKSSGADLRGGVETLTRITPSLLKEHNKPDDAWSAFYGKVYNITPYLSFHPGGEKELMRVAGRDGTKLFAATHGWVNYDFMLDACLVGFLVPE